MRILSIFATLSIFVACGEKGSDADGTDTASQKTQTQTAYLTIQIPMKK